jgi:hypothetical protein
LGMLIWEKHTRFALALFPISAKNSFYGFDTP